MAVMCAFDSRREHQAGVAQLAEHAPCKRERAGSIPVARSTPAKLTRAERAPRKGEDAGSTPVAGSLHADVAQRQSVPLITGRHPDRHRASARSTTCPGGQNGKAAALRLRRFCGFDSRPGYAWARSSSGRAPLSHSGGGRFESCRVHHADVAQWLEHPTVDRGAAGSIPVVGAHEGLAESGRWRRVASAERATPPGVRIPHPSPSRRSSAVRAPS